MTIGAIKDREFSSFVESPSRGDPYAAREVFVGNQHSDPVPTDPFRGPVLSVSNEVSLAAAASTMIITKTIQPSMLGEIIRVSVSGQNKGDYELLINGSLVDKYRTYYTHFNGKIECEGLKVSSGDLIEVNALNNGDTSAFFNCTLYYREYPL